jgi:hypothetical protein
MAADESREHEELARRSRTEAEAERAGRERLDEGGGDGGESGVLPEESDEERFGVMPPPAGSGAD